MRYIIHGPGPLETEALGRCVRTSWCSFTRLLADMRRFQALGRPGEELTQSLSVSSHYLVLGNKQGSRCIGTKNTHNPYLRVQQYWTTEHLLSIYWGSAFNKTTF